ncbi:MAG: hypothetical protein RI883_1018 [Bacteroidota bacterium]|jgi:HSP20 family protein
MTTLLKRKSILPTWTNDLLDTDNFISPRFFDLDGDGFEFAKSVPSVNINETEKEFKIEMAAPGLQRKDIKVEVENGILSISSEKEHESSEEKKNYTRKEYSYHSFNRSFSLPSNSLPDKINAKYDNGILNITLPKKEVTVSKPAKEIKVL